MKKQNKTPGLKSPKPAKELLDMHFFHIRSALLETAAALDRIERAEGGENIEEDPRIEMVKKACDILKTTTGNRAEKFLTLFSEPV